MVMWGAILKPYTDTITLRPVWGCVGHDVSQQVPHGSPQLAHVFRAIVRINLALGKPKYTTKRSITTLVVAMIS